MQKGDDRRRRRAARQIIDIVQEQRGRVRAQEMMDDNLAPAPVNVRPPPDVVAARQLEIAQRYERHSRRHLGPQSKKDRVRALRRAQVLRVLRRRYGPTLPGDPQGRDALQLLLELDLDGPSALAIAPWATGDELERLIVAAEANWRWWCGKIGHKIGVRLEVTFQEKTELALHHLGCIDADPRDVREYYRKRKRERDRARRARKRQETRARTEMTAQQEAPADYWDLMYSDPRAFGLVGCVLYDFQWWSISDLIAEMETKPGAFAGLGADAMRQAVHRATRRLERLGIVETKMEGRSKYVRRVPSAEDLAALEEQAREREALEEAARDFIDEDSA